MVAFTKTETKDTENAKPKLSNGNTQVEAKKDDGTITNFPWAQVLALGLVQLVSVSLITQIRPYFPFLIQELLGLDSRTDPLVALHTGLVSAVENVVQIFTCYMWGFIADTWGRKRAILIHCIGNILVTPLIGFSSSMLMLYVLFVIRGFFTGTSVLYVILSEITNPRSAPMAFALVVVSTNVGVSTGPIYGGQLYGKSLSIGFLEAYPAAAPCLVAGILVLIATIFFYFTVPETKHRTNQFRTKSFSSVNEPLVIIPPVKSENEEIKSLFAELKGNRDYWIATLLSTLMGFRLYCFGLFYSLYARVEEENGGYGWESDTIGTVQGIGSIPSFVMALFVFAPAVKRFGVLNVYSAAAVLPAVALFMFPLLPLAKDFVSQVAAFLSIMFVCSFSNSAVFPATNMLINATVPRDILGRANGLTRSIAMCGIALGQGGGGFLFGWSLNYELDGGPGSHIPFVNRNLVFYILGISALLQVVIPQFMDKKYQVPITPRHKNSGGQGDTT